MMSWSFAWFLISVFVVSQAHGVEPTAVKPPPLPDGTISKAVADRFIDGLRKHEYQFLSEDKLESLHKEIDDFASRYAPAQLPEKERESLFSAIDRYVPRHFPNRSPGIGPESDAEKAYLTFRDLVNTFKWQLWRALTRKPFTAEQLKQRQVQHDWLQQFVAGVPARPGGGHPPGAADGNAGAWAAACLEEMLTDPLGLMYDPMSDRQFELFKKLMDRSAANGLVMTIRDIPVRALGARAHTSASDNAAYDYPFDIELPFKDEVMSIYSGSEAQLAFASNARFRGQETSLDSRNRPVFDIFSGVCVVPIRPASGSLRTWWEKHFKTGDFAYDDKKARIFALRGAKIAKLRVADWFEADRVPDSELRKLISKDGKSAVSVKDLPPVNGERSERATKPRFFVVVQSHEGRLAVIDLQNREFGQVYLLSRLRPER